jgi:hypothetical protein
MPTCNWLKQSTGKEKRIEKTDKKAKEKKKDKKKKTLKDIK